MPKHLTKIGRGSTGLHTFRPAGDLDIRLQYLLYTFHPAGVILFQYFLFARGSG